jgi:hypothetical protein
MAASSSCKNASSSPPALTASSVEEADDELGGRPGVLMACALAAACTTLGSIVPLLFWGVLVVPCLFVSLAEVAAVDADEVALDTIRAAFEATERALQVFF